MSRLVLLFGAAALLSCAALEESATDASTGEGTQSTGSGGETQASMTTVVSTSVGTMSTSSTTTAATTGTSGPTDPSDPTGGPGTETAGTTVSGESTDSTETGPLQPDENGCPGDAPDAWIACEDFDAIVVPGDDLPLFYEPPGVDGLGIEPDDDHEGDQMLRVSLLPKPNNDPYGGTVEIRFGVGPDDDHVDSPEGVFDEVWVRYRFRTEAGWPGLDPGLAGELLTIVPVAGRRAMATNAMLEGRPEDNRVRFQGFSCINDDNEMPCDGQGDWEDFDGSIGSIVGGPIFDAAEADVWNCIEMHVRLNTPGQTDGEAGLWINDVAVDTVSNMNWRGTWTDYSLNTVRFTNYRLPEERHDYFVDDVVVSTEPVGCD